MNPLLVAGLSIVIFAFASYTTAIVKQIRQRVPTARLRAFLTAGVALDAASTSFMNAGSRRIPLTFHGVLGYISHHDVAGLPRVGPCPPFRAGCTATRLRHTAGGRSRSSRARSSPFDCSVSRA